MEDLDLISLICSRLCHDLVGPVGAVANGVEVLADEDDPDMRQQAVDLLAYSADLATARLKFYRLAFGASGGEGVPISLDEARIAAREFLAEGRVKLDWPDAAASGDFAIGKAGVKILLNLILLIAEAMPRGGDLTVDLTANGGSTHLVVAGKGKNARLADAIAVIFSGGVAPSDLQPKLSPAALVRRLADTIGAEVRLTQAEDDISLRIDVPVKR
jgi:histidine phosphotransferase ChpT